MINEGRDMFDYKDIRELFDISSPMGWDEDIMTELEKEYGSIPAALMDYYRTCAGCQKLALNLACNYLMPANKVGICREEGYYVFFSENQSVSLWGIKLSDMDKPDPAVYEKFDGGEWFNTEESLSKFLTFEGYMTAIADGLTFSTEDYYDADEEQVKDLRDTFQHIENTNSRIYDGTEIFRVNEDSYLAVMPYEVGAAVMFASKSKEGFDAAQKAVLPLLGY